MSSVYIDSGYKVLVELLTATPNDSTRKSVFHTNMELYVFAAMVGSQLPTDDFEEPSKGNEIPDSVFRNNGFDGLIYLLALFDRKTGEILRERSEAECWSISEKYATVGFEEINKWVLENPGVTDFTDIFLNRMKKIATSLVESPDEIEPGDVSFS